MGEEVEYQAEAAATPTATRTAGSVAALRIDAMVPSFKGNIN